MSAVSAGTPNDRILFQTSRFSRLSLSLQKGGHVAALHAHMENRLFFKIDVQNFYNSIARMRVTRALRALGLSGGWHIFEMVLCRQPARKRPPARSAYLFRLSPLLATLVLLEVARGSGAIERAIARLLV